ncbi:MAG: M56 family metallopeptidase, partial [Candidatus Sulfotelmatobacter sp.]
MMSPQFQTIAQIVIGRILNSLPEGVLVALFAWVTLRLLPRQNSGTRFAVWFVALLAVAGLPLIGSILGPRFLKAASGGHPLITLPGPWGALLLLAWVLAVSAGMLRLAVGLWRVQCLRRNCMTIDSAQLEPVVQKTLADFSSSRSVALATSEDVSVPSALGFVKPMIVIPAWALRELPAEELNIILLHE